MTNKIATLRIVDNAAQARELYGDQANYVAGRPLPDHDYRFELVITGGDKRAEASLHAGATAAHVAAYLERDAATLVDPGGLIGPLTASEWAEFRMRDDDDLLQCCAVTSEFRDAIFHLLRMGGEDKHLRYGFRGPYWRMVEHGLPDGRAGELIARLVTYFLGDPPEPKQPEDDMTTDELLDALTQKTSTQT